MKIVFFDGYCSLCNSFVNWIIRVDRKKDIKFASLQGQTASRFLVHSRVAPDFDTVIYLRGDRNFEKSTAIILILCDCGGLWRLSRAFLLIPKFIRDFAYQMIAKNRYHIFGKLDSCRMPTVEEQDRLLP